MFSVLENGWEDSNVTSEISLSILKSLIKNNEHKEKILQMHSMERGSYEYDSIKKKLPCVKPHGTFDRYCNTANFKQASGYIFFDVDKGDIKSIEHNLLTNYTDKISLLGKSVGGNGIFFYVKIANKEILTPENFLLVQNYLIQNIFNEIEIDLNAKGVNRNQVIPYDANLYSADVNGIYIPENIIETIEIKNCISSCNKNTKGKNVYTTTHTFLDIKEVNKHIVWKTVHDIGDADYIVQDVQSATLFIPRKIKDGNKHKVFKAMVNVIVFNNPKIEFLPLVSFINFINSHYADKPMKMQEMIFTVQSEFDRINSSGEIMNTKTRHVVTNKNLDKRARQLLGAKGVGEYKTKKSKDAIIKAIEILKDAEEKITQQNVADLLTGHLGIATIKKYWRSVVLKGEPVENLPKQDSVLNQTGSNEQDNTVRIESFDIAQGMDKELAFKKYRSEKYTVIFPKSNQELRIEFEDLWNEFHKKAS